MSTSQSSADSANKPPARQAKFPVKMSILSVLVIGVLVLAHVFVSEIEDAIHLGLDVIMMLTLLAGFLLMLMWLGWIMLFSRWRWYSRIAGAVMLLAVPVALKQILRPVHGGDTNLVRFEPIWMSRNEPLPTEVTVVSGVDLMTTAVTDFERFLGPAQDGRVQSGMQIDVPAFANSAKIVWKQPIGLGWSGFAARNGFAVTMEQRAEQECVTCLDVVTGELKWMYSHPARHKDTINLGRIGPRSTPTIHNGLVYATGAVGNMVCLNGTDGTLVWQQDLNQLLGITLGESVDTEGFATQHESNTTLAWGRSAAPLIVDDVVVVAGGGPAGPDRATLLAFDLLTGELKWKSGDEMIAYGSPVLATIAGRRQILLTAETKAMGFDATTGELLWSHSRPGESNGGANTSQVSVVSESDVLTSKGYPDGGGERIHIEQNGDAFVATSVWSSSRVLKTKLTSPVINDGFAYSLSNGFMECSRLSDGQQMWKRRGRFGHGQVLLIGNVILLHSESGELFLLEASPDEYRELATLKTIDGVCWNTLCLTGRFLLVRSEIEAACIEIPMLEAQRL